MRAAPVLAIALLACGPGVDDGACDVRQRFELAPDPGAAREAYLCAPLDRVPGAIRAIDVDVGEGHVVLHHLAVWAVVDPILAPDAWTECASMPEDAIELWVWIPGVDPSMRLPEGVALGVEGDRTLVVQAHALRVDDGPAPITMLDVCGDAAASQRAGWLAARVPVPAIRPRTTERSWERCVVEAPLTILRSTPHMHEVGSRFESTIVRADGSREPLYVVDPWEFGRIGTLDTDVALAPGDAIETVCEWTNPGGEYVLPGPLVSDEMCVQSLVVVPAASARCAPRASTD